MTAVIPTQRLGAPRSRSPFRKFITNKNVLRIGSIVVLLAIWQVFGVNLPYITSDPVSIVTAGVGDFLDITLPAFGLTLLSLAIGFVIAMVIGVALGLVMAFSRIVELALGPYISALYATPRIVLIPLLIIWLGVGDALRIWIVVIASVFPILLNTYLGAKEVDAGLLDAGRAFAASNARIFQILLRGSLPYVFTGIRIGLGHGLTSLIVVEILTSGGGIGTQISNFAKYFHVDSMFACVVLLGLLAMALTAIISRLDRRTTEPWLYSDRRAARQKKVNP